LKSLEFFFSKTVATLCEQKRNFLALKVWFLRNEPQLTSLLIAVSVMPEDILLQLHGM